MVREGFLEEATPKLGTEGWIGDCQVMDGEVEGIPARLSKGTEACGGL